MTDEERTGLLAKNFQEVTAHLRTALGIPVSHVVYQEGYFTAFRCLNTTGIDCTDLVTAWLKSSLS